MTARLTPRSVAGICAAASAASPAVTPGTIRNGTPAAANRSEEHTAELQSPTNLVCLSPSVSPSPPAGSSDLAHDRPPGARPRRPARGPVGAGATARRENDGAVDPAQRRRDLRRRQRREPCGDAGHDPERYAGGGQ